jgi:tetratricopeptide (TPR) repeat protein
MLWRILVALTEGDPETVDKAAAACPGDPEIWLASLVVRLRDEGSGPWLSEAVKPVAEKEIMPVATMVRAGDFLVRNKVAGAAVPVARAAIARCRGMVSAYVLGLQCALVTRNAKWALSCALKGIDNARDPTPFYKTIVHVKSVRGTEDADMITALEYLKEHVPGESLWAQQLGRIHFEKGDTKRAMQVFAPILEEGAEGVGLNSLLMAAESARREGRPHEAIRILETAYTMYPKRPSVLNNLVYNLAQDKRTIRRAVQLVPKLLATDSESFVVLDTAAMVYLRSGDVGKADEFIDRALARLNDEDYAALEVRLNAAEIKFRMGGYADARERALKVRGDGKCTRLLDLAARDLLARITEEEAKARR